MKHGIVQNESFAGAELMTPPSRLIYNRIGLPVHATYRFIGYKSSILRHLIDSSDCAVEGHNDLGFTIQIKISEVMKSGSEQIADSIRGGALGVAGEVVTLVDLMNNVLDGISVIDLVRQQLPAGQAPALKRPNRATYLKDHAINSRIMVDLSLHKGEKSGWIDTETVDCTLKEVAYAVNAA
ncbi:MAG: hypothetical protein AAF744_12820 [Pseudomonadota bacterium]